MTNPGPESQFETTTIERLKALGYQYQPASTLDRDLKSVVLALWNTSLRDLHWNIAYSTGLAGRPACAMHADRLRAHLARRYPHPSTGSGRRLPAKALDEAVAAARNPDGVTLDQRNMNFHQTLTRGYELKYEVDGQDRYEHVYFVDWEEPDNNDFLVVNRLTVEGENTR